MRHVFLSYSRTDRVLARRLVADLTRRGLTIWSDRMLNLGGQWLADISTAIGESRALVVLASPDGLSSKWVMREVAAAQGGGIPVVPMLAGGVRYGDLPGHLAGVNGVDLDEDYDLAIAAVAATLSRPPAVATGTGDPASAATDRRRRLLHLTKDPDLVGIVAAVGRSLGMRVIPFEDVRALFPEIARAHVVLVDADDGRWNIPFVVGYAAGSGGWAVCVARGNPIDFPESPGVASVAFDADRIGEAIYAAAFRPARVSPDRPRTPTG